MPENQAPSAVADALRQRAEARLREQSSSTSQMLTEVESLRLIHELQAHQIELELQNEELRETRARLEQSLENLTQIEQTLRYYERIVAATPDAVALLDRNYVYLAVNAEYLRRTGAPREAIVRRSVGEIMGEGVFQTLLKDKLDRCLAGELVQHQSWFDVPTQGRRFLDVRYAPYRAETGAIAGVVINSRDITDFKWTEEALRKSEACYRAVVEDQAEVISRFTPDGVLTFVNEAYCRFLGKTSQELLGAKWQLKAVTEDLPRIQEKLCILSPAIPIVVLENRVHSGAGEVRWMQFVNRAFFDPEGRIVEIQSVGRDITALKQTEERLRESEAKIQSIFRAAPISLGLTVDRIIQAVNQTTCQLLGYAPEELIGKSARLLYVSQADFDFVGTEKYRQLRDQGVGTVETRWRRKDGVILNIVLSSAAIDPTDLSKGISFSALDITARKQAEARLRASEQRFRTLVELLPYGVQENDSEGRITFANPALEHLHGPWEGGVVGRFIWDFLADEADSERLRDYLQFLVREQPPPTTYFSKNHCADGSLIDIQVDWTYHRDEHGRVQGFFSVITDITARRKAELRLAENTERLQQLSRRLLSVQEEERRALARELHDDFGQQLTALKLNLALLERDLRDPTHRNRLHDCIQIIEHTREHIQNTARRLHPSILDDLGLVEALYWYARSQAQRAGCVIEVQDRLPALLSPKLETAVFRIVQEAVNNAIRHGAARRIDIAVAVDCGELALAIQDDGAGFDPDALPTDSESGLGLISMRERAELLGGRFALASRLGGGVRVEVTIPLEIE